ncbi:MAG: tRNA guanosine(34) transglycosylase Tgt [Planctomycetota bacterium]|jgi:queuine tRNA-ribosyltransferase|nr:tRNA guanosine(34) transglycosylase Tgt [Planctomycetota bacterium]MDP6762381.1 tRNA guanosine(34) transglycosylase Tgt [Planctomycetota bacterium]MDP6990336.1 tRNA guanosine(34) transglycosylase Tgt [Planctomycetota bacterium]
MSDPPFAFERLAACPESAARRGRFHTPHGAVETPAFMPVGTRATVKGVLPADLRRVGTRMVLANTYHLHLRPGEEVVAELGGLHAMMAWDGPILTDSGGFQVFSMSDLCRVDEGGVDFRSTVDGSRVRMTPEGAVDIQRALGADVAMAFDHCPARPGERGEVLDATDRTHRWLERCVARHRELGGLESGQALFGIVQGGAFEDLRRASLEAVCAHDLAGYAVGGISLGEDREAMRTAMAATGPHLPEGRPRYLMGVGTPRDFFDAVELGFDLFDCVTPTRNARNHTVFTSFGRLNLRNRGFARDPAPLDPRCDCVACTDYSRGTLRHLCTTDELLAATLLSLHNLRVFHTLLARIREAISAGRLARLREECAGAMSRRLTPEEARASD